MDNQAVHVMTIANSIIGVSIIAMPYCFKQCGIILSMLILIVSSIISRLSCHLLLKSAIMARRRTFEFLAFHAFGPLGKFIVEIGLIGFLLGTCIAFFVVMGDLGPAIIVKMTGTRATDTLRTSILMALALFCVLPLGLLRNIDSLSSVCTATIGFYFCLVLKIVVQSIPHIFSGDWIDKVELWRPAGFLQCLPIFSMALFCQTQIFEIYQAIPNASLEKMNALIRLAVNICTAVYIFVGIFGYIAFSNQTFTGNILMSFPSSLMSEVIKMGFVLSVAFSFPLIIFPCRASLYSLLYKRLQTYSLHEGADKYIPEGRFKGLTFMIVFVSLVIGVMIPNIELVLGLVGSTIGIMICVLFPAMCFICISTKNTNERILAQLMLFIGVIVMVLGTYANLYAMEEMTTQLMTEKVMIQQPEILQLIQKEPPLKVIDIPSTSKVPVKWLPNKEPEIEQPIKEVRHEPPQPEEPAELPAVPEIKNSPKEQVDVNKFANGQHDNKMSKEELENNKAKDLNLEKPIGQAKSNVTNRKNANNPVLQQPIDVEIKESNQHLHDNVESIQVAVDNNKLNNLETGNTVSPFKTLPVKQQIVELENTKLNPNKAEEQEGGNVSNGKKIDEVPVAKEAIEKEEKELLDQEKEQIKEEAKKNLDLLKSLEEHNKQKQQLVEEEKKLLKEIRKRQQDLDRGKQQNEIDKVKQEKLKAVVQIEEIAKKAIEKLSGADRQNGEENTEQTYAGKQPFDKQVKLNQNIEQLPKAKHVAETPTDVNKQIPVENSQQDNIEQLPKDVKVKQNNEQFQQDDAKMKNKIRFNDLNLQSVNQLDGKNQLELNNKIKHAENQIGLTKENLVPLPIALSNNRSEIYRNIKKGMSTIGAKSKIHELPKSINANVNLENVKEIELKQDNVQQMAINEQLVEGRNKAQDQINLLDVLRTKVEKVPSLNTGKQENILLHREIRSVDGKQLSVNIEEQQFYKKEDVETGAPEKSQYKIDNKDPKESTVLVKSEASCEKNDGNTNAKKEEKISFTETALIKMITKLSEPELVSLQILDVDNLNVDSILKPLKRDLKSYKSRRRK